MTLEHLSKVAVDGVAKPLSIDIAELEKLYLYDNGNNLVQFRPTPVQRLIVDNYNNEFSERGYSRSVVPKCRKFGSSTVHALVCYLLVRNFGIRCAIIGHNKNSASLALEKIVTAMKNDKANLGVDAVEKKNSQIIKFSNGGQIIISTSRNPDALTGGDLQLLLMTEFGLANGNEQTENLRSLLPQIGLKQHTAIWLESTCRKSGDLFHQMCLDARDGKGNFRFQFYGWSHIPEYSLPFITESERENLLTTLNEDETVLMQDFNISAEQINWRRATFSDVCQNNSRIFKSEFPFTLNEAFSSDDTALFDVERISIAIDQSRLHPPIYTGEFRWTLPITGIEKVALGEASINEWLMKMSNGRFKIWQLPAPYIDYVIGADVASGAKNAFRGDKTDDSTIVVIEQESGMVVATWAGKIRPHDFADLLTMVGVLYNSAFLVVERNNHGESVVERLIRQYNNARIYRRQSEATPVVYLGNPAHSTEAEFGFLTREKSKIRILNQASFAFANNELTIYDADLLREMEAVYIDQNEKCETNGLDLLMAFVLAVEGASKNIAWNRPPEESTPYDDYLRFKAERKRRARELALSLKYKRY